MQPCFQRKNERGRKMKKKGVIVLIFVILTTIILVKMTTKPQPELQPVLAEPEFHSKEPVEWHAKYIWDHTTENNSWLCFRKKVDLKPKDIENVTAQIAVDSKYWLYINGEMVVREGALKRGEIRNSIYYDEIDLTNYLQAGENTIAILVWYWGDTSYSHDSSGQGAMLFQAKIGNNYLMSNETWKVAKHKAYLQDELRPNKRLIEYNVYYDATQEDENWYQSAYDDSAWENARILGDAGAEPWGTMIERGIPQFKDYGLKEYENMGEYIHYTTTETENLVMKIPYNAQFSPYLKIEAPAGQKITIKTDQYEDISGDSVKCTYLTKEGLQEFESLAWMNGENVYYEIPKGIKIVSLGYRETGYATEMTGNFQSDNEFFNQLWEKASRTLYVNMRDSYMDCPNRERAQWFGDMSMEMMEAMYAMDTNAYLLYEKGIRTTIGWKVGNILTTVSPIAGDCLYLPTQMLAGINSMYEYYEYTGKTEFLEMVYPHIKDFLDLWHVQPQTGLVETASEYPPIWEWGDSVAECDYKAIENAWYYGALGKLQKMADILGKKEESNQMVERLANLKTNYHQLWTENGYQTPGSPFVDERANALAVLSGLADADQYDTITNILTTSQQSTVYMEKYVLEALCQMGKIEEAQERIQNRYNEMVNGEEACSTLWENWNVKTGTKNHAWAGGPLIIMSKYFAGIEPLEKGYDVISVKPQFGKLKRIICQVNTNKGQVILHAKKEESEIYLKIETPAKTRVAIEKIGENSEVRVNGETIYQKGKQLKQDQVKYITEDEKYVYLDIERGTYEFISLVHK